MEKERNQLFSEGEVLVTSDYEQFEFVDGNRPINKTNLKRLESQVKISGYIDPITCCQEMYILDGQHRFEVAKKIGYAIQYKIVRVDGHKHRLQLIQRLNTAGKTWSPADILRINSMSGNEFMKAVEDFVQKFSVGVPIAYSIFRGEVETSDQMKVDPEQDYPIATKDRERAALMGIWLEDFRKILGNHGSHFNLGYIKFMLKIIGYENYSHEVMLKGIESSWGDIETPSDTSSADWRNAFAEVYNSQEEKVA